METISTRFQEDVLKKMDENIIKYNFNSRTEFIREAVRDKLNGLSREDLIKEFLKFKGKSGKKTSYKDNKTTRTKVSKELMGELRKKFS